MDTKFVYVGFAFTHLKDTHAGYHQIRKHLPYDFFIDSQREFDLLHKKNKNFVEKVWIKVNTWLGGGMTLTMLKCIILSFTKSDLTFHFIHPENTFKWGGLMRRRGNKIVFTLHQPVHFYKKNPKWKKILLFAESIIILSKDDLNSLKKFVGHSRCYFIPHGIDTDFYCNSIPMPLKSKNILMVGNWLRDFHFANEIFSSLLTTDKDISNIVVIGNPENHKFFTPNSKLILRSGITDYELREYYRNASLLFLPMTAFTANNAILEAAACELKIIISSNHSDTSYFDSSEIDYLPLNKELVLQYIRQLFSKNISLSNEKLREKVVKDFSWSVIAEKTLNVLQTR